MGLRATMAILLSLTFVSSVFSQSSTNDGRDILNINDKNIDATALMAKARASYDARKLDRAMIYARAAQKKQPIYPEADYLTALIYSADAEWPLAEASFNKALTYADKYERPIYLYALADAYRGKNDITSYKDTLRLIVREDSSSDVEAKSREVATKQALVVLKREGLNRVLQLYRHKESASLKAIETLAIYHYREGGAVNYDKSIEYLLQSIIRRSDTLITRLKYYRPDYEFTTVDALLDEANDHAETRAYLATGEYYRSLYFLGAGIYAREGASQSKLIWNRIRLRREAGEWANRAQDQFFNPHPDSFALDQALPRYDDNRYDPKRR